MSKESVLAVRWRNRKDSKCIRLSVSGSRILKDERVKILLLEEIKRVGATRITTHAEPGGVCEVARNLCKEKGMPLVLHHLNFKNLRGAFYKRTLAVFYDTDYAIFIHDGISKGTKNEFELAKKMNIPHRYEILEVSKYTSSVGFDIDTEWINMEMEE